MTNYAVFLPSLLSISTKSYKTNTENDCARAKSNQIKKFYLKSVHFITIQHKLSRAFQTFAYLGFDLIWHVHNHSPCLFCQYLQTEVKGVTNAHTC
jgi:hypothetical protein